MSHRRKFVAIALSMMAAGFTNAASQPQSVLAGVTAKPITMTVAQLSALRAALQRREVVAVRARIRALADKQPDRKRFIDFTAIENSRTPVLIVPDQLESLRVIVRGEHYTAVTQLGNATVTIDGTHPAVTLLSGVRLPSAESRSSFRPARRKMAKSSPMRSRAYASNRPWPASA